jgi:hypothetical protein
MVMLEVPTVLTGLGIAILGRLKPDNGAVFIRSTQFGQD